MADQPRVFELEPSDVSERFLAWEAYQADSPVLMAHGQNLNLLPKDNYSRKLFVFRRQHMSLLFALARFSLCAGGGAPGSCWDVGANIGYISAFLAKRADVREVFAFEPNERVFPILLRNAKRYPKIHATKAAVGAAPGETVLRVDLLDSGLSSAASSPSSNWSSSDQESSERAEIVSIDSLAEHHRRRVDFIKIDVEGGEVDVLLGAKASIREWRPMILLEWHDFPGHRKSVLEAFREASGGDFSRYRLLSFDSDGVLSQLAPNQALSAPITDIFLVPEGRSFRS